MARTRNFTLPLKSTSFLEHTNKPPSHLPAFPETSQLPKEITEMADVPRDFLCPISGEIMKDPYILTESGHSYEKEEILKWIHHGSFKDPLTGSSLPSMRIVPNHSLRKLIQSSPRTLPSPVGLQAAVNTTGMCYNQRSLRQNTQWFYLTAYRACQEKKLWFSDTFVTLVATAGGSSE